MWRLLGLSLFAFFGTVTLASLVPLPKQYVEVSPAQSKILYSAYPYISTFATTATKPLTNSSLYDDSIDARFVGLLSHVRWLIAQNGTSGTSNKLPSSQLTRIDRQFESLSDDISDSHRDLLERIESLASLGEDSVTPSSVLSIGKTDEYCLTYELTGDTWEWQSCGTGGVAWATSSANYWESTQSPRSADDLTNNSIEDLQDVAAMTKTYGDLLYWNGSAWADIATSSLGISAGASFSNSAQLASLLSDETGNGALVFAGSPTLTGTLTAAAANFSGNVGIGTTTPNQKLTIQGNINLSAATGAVYFDDIKYLYASSTNDSVVFGENAGATFNSGTTENIAIGLNAGRYASTTDDSVYIGSSAGQNNSGWGSVLLGYQTGENNTHWSVHAIGYQAGRNNTGGENNFMGYQAGYQNTGESGNFFGSYAGYNNTGLYNNNLFGYGAGYNNTGDENNIFGQNAGYNNTGSYLNVFGDNTGRNNSGSDSNFLGRLAGYNNTGSNNNFLGRNAGYGNSGDNNTFLGAYAGRSNNGFHNYLIGYNSGYNNAGNVNFIAGPDAGYNNTGSNNFIFGDDAGYNNNGNENFIAGSFAGYHSDGDYNFFTGYNAGRYIQGDANIALGAEALLGSHATNYLADNNIAIGYRAGYASDDGAANNILIGYRAADNLTTGNNNIIIGYDIDNVTATADNRLNIGNLIFGTGLDGAGTTLSTGNLGIASTSPSAKLTIQNTGTGNSFIVEDQAGDTSPFVIDASGSVGIGVVPSATGKLAVAKTSTNTSGFSNTIESENLINPSSNSTGSYFAANLWSHLEANDAFRVTGLWSEGDNNGSGTVTNLEGIYAYSYNFGTVTNGSALKVEIDNGGVTTNQKILNVSDLINVGTITNTYGLYLGDLTAGTQTNQPYAIYSADAGAKSYFAGDFGIASTSPSAKLTIQNTGTGNSFIVEDQAGDTSPFVIDASGNVGVGIAASTNNEKFRLYHETALTYGRAGSFRIYADPISAGSSYTGLNADSMIKVGNIQGVNSIYGITGSASHYGTGTIGTSVAFSGTVENASTATMSYASVFEADAWNDVAGGTITDLKILNVSAVNNSGTITNTYGLYLGDLTSGTQTNQPYAIYSADAGAKSYFAGDFGIGSTSPSAKLTIQNTGSGNSFIVEDQTGDTSPFVIDASGNVGVGTTTPAEGFSVQKRSYFTYAMGIGAAPALGGSALTIENNLGNIKFMTNGVTETYLGRPFSLFTGGGSGFGIRTNGYPIILSVSNSSTTGMFVSAIGNVGVGLTNPAQKLQVLGNIRVGTSGSNGCLEDFGGGVIAGTCSSDERLKENIEPLASSTPRSYLEALTALTPVTYTWNEEAAERYSKNQNVANLGLIAQDVESVFPELISFNDDGYRQVDFRALPFYIIEALKELWQKVKGHDERLQKLEEENEQLKSRLNEIETDLNITPPSPSLEPEPMPESVEEGQYTGPEEISSEPQSDSVSGVSDDVVSSEELGGV